MYSFSKMNTLSEVYNRIKSASLNEAFEDERALLQLKKRFDKFSYTKIGRDQSGKLVLSVSYNYADDSMGTHRLRITANPDGTFNVNDHGKDYNNKTLDDLYKMYNGRGDDMMEGDDECDE